MAYEEKSQRGHEVVARAILREVPLARISRFLTEFGDPNPLANGNGCGNGCGAGCIDGFGLTFDRFGQSEITAAELETAHRDVEGLKSAMADEVSKIFR